jgi:putative transposase
VLLSYKYRIEPNKTQGVLLSEMLADFCQLYNAALEQRIAAYQRRGISLRYQDQAAELKATRLAHDGLARWSYSAEQQVLRKLEKTFAAFFGRIRRGAKPGFPRFRARDRYHAADFRVGDGLTIRKSGKLGFVGVQGEIKVCWHRALPSEPKSAILTRQAGKWYIVFHVEVTSAERASPDSVGIDMGLTSLVALSNGETIARPNITKRNAPKLRVLQRALARCKRGSKVRRKRRAAVAKLQAHIGNSRRDFLHKESRKIINRFGRIAVEDLNIKGLASGMLAKHVNDASWAQLTAMLAYKAASAGCEFVKVNPRGTSQTCPECGTVAEKELADRVQHSCDCGCRLDRDVAAAMIVHFRAFGFLPGAGSGTLSGRIAA